MIDLENGSGSKHVYHEWLNVARVNNADTTIKNSIMLTV